MKSKFNLKKALLLTSLSIILFSSFDIKAGGARSYRDYCADLNKRFKAFGLCTSFGVVFQASQTGNCNQAQVIYNASHCGYNVAAAYSSNFTSTWHNRWWAWAGFGYIMPTTTPSDTIGFGTGSFKDTVAFIASAGLKGKIKISNIKGSLISTLNSKYSSCYRIIIWAPSNLNDTTNDEAQINSHNIVWEAGVYLDNGVLKTTGHFSPGNFSTQTKSSSFTSPSGETTSGMVKEIDCNNFNFTIDIKTDIIDHLTASSGGFRQGQIDSLSTGKLVVTVLTHGGWGQYTDPYSSNTGGRTMATALADNSAVSFEPVIYPNPASSVLNISNFNVAGGKTEIKIINFLGQVVKQITVPENYGGATFKIEISDLKDDFYSISIESAVKTKILRFGKFN